MIRAIVVALLLLSVGGGIARADGTLTSAGTSTNTLPDDPGYELTP
jgi:hypothetical protein